VGVQVRVNVTGDPAAAGLKSEKFEAYQGRAGEAEGAAPLPNVQNPPKTPARQGAAQAGGGYVLKPAADSRRLEVLAYNTGGPIKLSNVSHAEQQVINFLEGQDEAWLSRVESIDAVVIGRDICELCDLSIQNLQTTINKLRKDRGLPDLVFNWIRGDR
jgi:hypothetical protein